MAMLKGPLLFLLRCAPFVFIFGMIYMIFKFIAIKIFEVVNVSIIFVPRIANLKNDDDKDIVSMWKNFQRCKKTNKQASN